MAFQLAANLQHSNELKQEYAARLAQMDLKQLVAEFLSYLEYEEESESGRVVRPVVLSSYRALMTVPLTMVIERLREESA